MYRRPILALAAFLLVAPRAARAHVDSVVVDRQAFGGADTYERLTGRVFYSFDPANPHDRQIVDLALAPRNARGRVEAWDEFVMLRPADPGRGSERFMLPEDTAAAHERMAATWDWIMGQ